MNFTNKNIMNPNEGGSRVAADMSRINPFPMNKEQNEQNDQFKKDVLKRDTIDINDSLRQNDILHPNAMKRDE